MVWSRGRAVVFGGVSEGVYLGDMHIYNPIPDIWYNDVQTVSAPPSARSNMGFASVQGQAFLLGGMDESGTKDDFWCFDVDKVTWTQLDQESISGPLPSKRHSMGDFLKNGLQQVPEGVGGAGGAGTDVGVNSGEGEGGGFSSSYADKAGVLSLQPQGPAPSTAATGSPAAGQCPCGGTRERPSDFAEPSAKRTRHAGEAEDNQARGVRGNAVERLDAAAEIARAGGAVAVKDAFLEIRELRDALNAWGEGILLFYLYDQKKDEWPFSERTFELQNIEIRHLRDMDLDPGAKRIPHIHKKQLVKSILDVVPAKTLPAKDPRELFKYVMDEYFMGSFEQVERERWNEILPPQGEELNEDEFYAKVRFHIEVAMDLHAAVPSHSFGIFLRMPSWLADVVLYTVRSNTAVQDRLLDLGYRRVVDSQMQAQGCPGDVLVCCYNIGKCPGWIISDGVSFTGAGIAQEHRNLVDRLSREYRGPRQQVAELPIDLVDLLAVEVREHNSKSTKCEDGAKKEERQKGDSVQAVGEDTERVDDKPANRANSEGTISTISRRAGSREGAGVGLEEGRAAIRAAVEALELRRKLQNCRQELASRRWRSRVCCV